LITFNGSNNWWIQVQVSNLIVGITKVSFQSVAGYVDSLPVSSWSNHEFTLSASKMIPTGSDIKIRIIDNQGKSRYFTSTWFSNASLKETSQFQFTTVLEEVDDNEESLEDSDEF
jgi:hypothetical protein